MVSLFKSVRDNAPTVVDWQPDDVVRWLSRPVVATSKETAPCWSPCLFDGTRSLANATESWFMVLDYDNGTTPEAASKRWERYTHLWHTTYSHTLWAPKVRLILPMDKPYPADQWPRLWSWANERSGKAIDPQCKDVSRIYLAPCVEPGKRLGLHYRWGVNWGKVLDPGTLRLPQIAPPPAPPRAHLPRLNHQRQRDAKAADREQWAISQGGRETLRRGTRWWVDMRCPKCGRIAMVVSENGPNAFCNHRNTCGWRGTPWLT